MSVKKKTIEERLSQSIFYNLSILKIAAKTTADFDENLSETIFLKSNTKAFIHITHFLFNILDPKEFKAKFYWPIAEKKAENSYRSSAVDFINNTITKHNLAQEKVKLVFVVHPCGKKFMSLILDLIILATKEIMKRRKIPEGKSFDIEKVTRAVSDMKDIETNIVLNIKQEMQVVKEKTLAIEELIKRIFPSEDFPMPFNELIEAWHDNNKAAMTDLINRDERVDQVFRKTAELHAFATKMLAPKVYAMNTPPLVVITEVADFYKNAGLSTDNSSNPDLNFSWFLTQLHLVFPTIVNYVSKFSLDPSDNSASQLKVLTRLSDELIKIERKTDDFTMMFKNNIPELIAKLRKTKEKRQRLEEENQSADELSEKTAKHEMELDKMKLLSSPKYYFDTSKECLKHVVVKKNRLMLFEDADEKENVANQTKIYRSIKSPYVNRSKMNHSVMVEMAPPKQQLRRRLDPMALLEKATSNAGSRGKQDLNATSRYTGAIPKASRSAPKFSSTLLSPDLRQPFFNCSIVSEIVKGSPLVIDSPGIPMDSSLSRNLNSIDQQMLNVPKDFDKSIEMSPNGKLRPLVSSAEIFKKTPKLALNDDTMVQQQPTTDSPDSNATIVNPISEGGSSDSFSFGSVIIPNDENLFNISDSILKGIED